ncbi:MAG: hypothetical protein DRG30_09595 [Epsilonproteobacteria bacterium]|nr:MAG: hypothetical protein DRG30_09595 [Campylobacterota bacterium]
MPEPTLEVVVERLKGLTTLINTKFETNWSQHSDILEHQKVTNGRVNKLEDWKETHNHDIEKEMSKKFASKRVEKNFDKVVMLVITGVIVGVLNLVLK